MNRKWTERKYHIQDNADVELKNVKCTIIQINSQHYPFVVHIPNLMVQGELASIIICVLIQNLAWVNVQFAVYHVHVLLVHQCWTKHGYLVYHQKKRHDINQLVSAHIITYTVIKCNLL